MTEFAEEVSGLKYQMSDETVVQRDRILTRIGSAMYINLVDGFLG